MQAREMLELAAKAAGYESQGWEDGKLYLFGVQDGWNPLTDDGDAMRLAAKLKIDLEWQSTGEFPEPGVEAYRRNAEGSYFCASEHDDDYRRAIVRAAAEIGKAMS